jgi:hypothetical protein
MKFHSSFIRRGCCLGLGVRLMSEAKKIQYRSREAWMMLWWWCWCFSLSRQKSKMRIMVCENWERCRKLDDSSSICCHNGTMRLFYSLTLLSCLVSSGLSFQPTLVGRLLTNHGGGRFSRDHARAAPVMGLSNASTSLTATAASSSESEEWTQKRIHNTSWFRSSAIVLALGLAGVSQKSPMAMLSAQSGATIHLLSFGAWFGTVFYTTFIAGLTMFKNLPRQTFGKLQSKLFPKYFLLCTISILLQVRCPPQSSLVVCIFDQCLSGSWHSVSSIYFFHFSQVFTLRSLPLEVTKRVTLALGAALSSTLLNLFFLEPYSTKLMFERYDLENTEGGLDTDRYKVLKKTFGKMHGISSLSNLIALCGAVAHGFILSSLLVVG